MTPDNRPPDEDRIATLLAYIRPTPSQRFYERMAAMPWNQSSLTEKEQIMRLSRLLKISTIATVCFALLFLSVSVYALSQHFQTPEQSPSPTPIILPRDKVAVALPNWDFMYFPPDLQVGDIIYYLIPFEGDQVTEDFLNRTLGEDFPRPHALGFLSLQGTVIYINGDIITLATTPSDALRLVDMTETRQSLKPTMIIPGDSIPPGYFAWTTAVRQDAPLQAGDHVRAWVDIFTIPYCLGCPDSEIYASPEDIVVCQNLLADDVEITAVSLPPASMNLSEEEQSSLQIITLAVPEAERKTFDKPINRPYFPVRLEAIDGPENTPWPACDSLSLNP